MNRYLLRVYTTILLFSLILLNGCATGIIMKSDNGKSSYTATTVANPLEQVLLLSDDQLVIKYASGVDLCLGDDLLFTDAKDIPSETLFTFFCYITVSDDYGSDYHNKWYNEDDNNFHVPVVEVTDVLNKYFDGINFAPTKINGYNAQTKEIVNGLQGFGGERFPKLSDKKQYPIIHWN